MRFLALCLLAIAPGCGGSDGSDTPTAPPGGGAENIPCTGSYSGAVSGTFSCAVVARQSSYPTTSSLEFTVSNLQGTALDLTLQGVAWDGPMATGTYTETSTSVTSAYDLVVGGTASAPVGYALLKNWGGTDAGSFTLTLDSVAIANATSTPATYTAHGTFTGTFVRVPSTGTPPSVTVAITF